MTSFDRTIHVPVLLIALTLAVGCSADSSASLERRGDRPSAHEINRRLREMQRVRLGDGTAIDVTDEGPGTSLEDLVRGECFTTVKTQAKAGLPLASCAFEDWDAPTTCNAELCSSQLHLCAAGLLLDIAESPIAFELGTSSIPPQSRATKAAIRETAAIYAREASIIAGNALRRSRDAVGATGACTGLQSVSGNAGVEEMLGEEMTLQEVFAETLGQGPQIAQGAIDDAADDTLAVADALPATMSSYTVGHWAQWYGATLSYVHLANLYVDVQLPEDDFDSEEPPCSSHGADTDNLVSNRAIDLLHNAAINPNVLVNLEITPEALWTGAGLTGPDIGGIRDRLYERTGDPIYSPTATAPMTLTQFYEASGLTGGELNAARVRVAEAARDMSPAPMATFTPAFVPTSPAFTYYAATSRPPAARGEALAARLAAGLAGTDMNTRVLAEGSDGFRPTMAYARASQANFVDWVATVSSELVADLGPSHPLVPHIAPTAATFDDLRTGRLRIAYADLGSGALQAEFVLAGDYSASDLAVVTGAAAASCAIDGYVNGEACTFSQHTKESPFGSVLAPRYGFQEYLYFVVKPSSEETLYLLERRDGSLSSGPGDYELIQALDLDWASAAGGVYRYAAYPIAPVITEQAEQALTSNVHSCDQNEVSCTGLLRNARIPLENSLSEDGDGWESSWRHYLALAREAARTADELGQAWIDTGYTIDDRTETAWDQIEDECGSVGEIANDTDSFATPGATCTTDSECDTDERGERCVNGTCLVTPTGRVAALSDDDPRAARVAECLGLDGAAVVPFATLGSKPLCMWYNPTTDAYCEDFTGAPSCPYEIALNADGSPVNPSIPCLVGPDGSTVNLPTTPATWTFREVHDTIGISRDQYSGAEDPGDIWPTCNWIRSGWSDHGVTDRLINQHIQGRFTHRGLLSLASRVGWVAEPMNLSHITLDRSPWVPKGMEATMEPPTASRPAGTGFLRNGVGGGAAGAISPDNAWPCGGRPADVYCTGSRSKSLFCQQVDCDAPSQPPEWTGHRNRALINDRMARAVLALQLATGASMGNVRSPFFSAHPEANWFTGSTTDSERLATIQLGDNTPSESLTRLSHILHGSTCDGATCFGTRTFYGDAYCFDTCSTTDPGNTTCPPMWSTQLANDTWEHRQGAGCVAANTGDTLNQIFIAFDPRRYDGLNQTYGWFGSQTATIVPTIWGGVIGERAVVTAAESSVRGRLANLMHDVLRGEVDPSTVVLDQNTGNVTDFTAWWDLNNESEVAIAGQWSGHANDGGAFTQGLTAGNFLDALELACELTRSGATACDPNAPPPDAGSIRDLPAVRAHFECVAAQIEDVLDRAVIPNVPRAALRGVSPSLGGTGFRVEQGAYGTAVVKYAAALEALRSSIPEVARALRANERDIEQLEILIQQLDNQEQSRILDLIATATSNTASCAQGLLGMGSDISSVGSAIVGCANGAAQISISIASTAIQGETAGLELQSQIIDLNQRFDDRMGRMADIADQIRQAVADLQAASVDLTNRRQAANRALARATLADADANGRLLRSNTVLRRRYSTARTRYLRAFEHAQRMAYLARLAIEQHVGMDLNAIQSDMTLVPRPDSWADRVCTVTGLDYERIRDVRDPAYEDYADQYIGDYVALLERFVESYRIDFPFQDGRDTVVLSARDDIAHARASCDVPSSNLLYASGDLDADVGSTAGGEALALWQVSGCEAPDPEDPIQETCVARARVTYDPKDRPFQDWHGHFDQATVFDVAFGPRFTEETAVTQRIWLSAGRYRLSWYVIDTSAPALNDVLVATDASGAALRASPTGMAASVGAWKRYFFLFDVPAGQEVHVSWLPPNPTGTAPQSYTVAAPMLEAIASATPSNVQSLTSTSVQDDFPPAEYAETDLAGEQLLPTCSDTTGVVFRNEHWTRRCQDLCPSGFDDGTCEGGRPSCYYEMEFNVDPDALARGGLFRRPGFARGNYNYRIDRIGLNFTGTASRDCGDSRYPETCYSNGWIPYTLLHQGRQVVIDHYGATDYVAPINPGRMENVRGLAAERYLTNPLSSADRALIEDYMQPQLRGRPLPGRYVLRVWDAPGVNFNGIEDVQIVLGYSYWTRQR